MFKATIAYDGTRYFGWQKTRSGPSIQEEIEKAIAQITGESALPEAASRTDRGVHAEGQVIQFSLKKSIQENQLLRGLNGVLPDDIRIKEIKPHQFHPTLDAVGKEYHYHLSLGPVQDPTQRLYSWHIPTSLDFQKMQNSAQELIGTHDFTAFANEPEKNPLCTVHSIEFKSNLITIKGNRFLYKMVRNIVGSLIYIGSGKLNSLGTVLASRDRKMGGITAPAHGLYLHQVFYPVN